MAILPKRSAASSAGVTTAPASTPPVAPPKQEDVSAAAQPAPAATSRAAETPNTSTPEGGAKPQKAPAKGDRFLDLGRDRSILLSDAKKKEAELVELLRSDETRKALQPFAGDPQRFIDAAVAYVTDRSDENAWARLIDCNPASVVDAVKDLAAVDLPPNSVKGTAFLSPRWDRNSEQMVCTSLPGVRGLEDKICSSTLIASIVANTVRAQDEFNAEEGVFPKLVHKRKLGIVDPEKNPIVASYAVITATDGRVHVTVLPIQQKTLEFTGEGGKKKSKTYYERQDQGFLNTDRMSPDVAASYAAQRAAMRKVGRTWLKGDQKVQAALNLEDAANHRGQEVDDNLRLTKAEASKNPVVRDAKVSTPEVQASQGESAETKASVSAAV